MKRSTNILGFTFLALAATLAASITMRNSPARSQADSGSKTPGPGPAGARNPATPSDRLARPDRPSRAEIAGHSSLKVSLPDDLLVTLPPAQRQAWLDRAAAVEREASATLEKLTTHLDLNATQRRKLFPSLVRAASAYDPAMLVGGATVAADPSLTPAEEIHSLLDPDQQAQVEDTEVQRQLWWQDIIGKLEADLTVATGGVPAVDPSVPAVPAPTDEERVAPEARDDGNLFDLIAPQ